MKPRRNRQTSFQFRTWGGRRPGAGRKPHGPRAGVPHTPRPSLARRFPVHVTVRMRDHVWNLRSRRSFRILARCFWAGADRFGFRLVHYSVQGNHLHLLAEAEDARALGRGMKGLGVRIARGLNRLMSRRGRVLADRYHARILRTPTEVGRAATYVRENAQHHAARRGERLSAPPPPDPYASVHPVVWPRTWLLARAGPPPT